MSTLILFLALSVGLVLGWFLRNRAAFVGFNRRCITVSLWALLFFMGAKLAQHRELFAQDRGIFLLAVASSLFLLGVFGGVFALWAWFTGQRGIQAQEVSEGVGGHEFRAVAFNGGWILAGFLVFWALPAAWAAKLPVESGGDWLLRALLFFIGVDLGVELHRLDLRKLALPVLLAPLFNILLTLGTGALFSLFTRLSLKESLLLVSGLGWYSLSSVLISNQGLALLGILAFIHNVFRELLAILSMPLAARISPYLPVYVGGATSMDVTLPFIQKYCGREYTLPAFYSGLVCSLAVIPLVKLLLAW